MLCEVGATRPMKLLALKVQYPLLAGCSQLVRLEVAHGRHGAPREVHGRAVSPGSTQGRDWNHDVSSRKPPRSLRRHGGLLESGHRLTDAMASSDRSQHRIPEVALVVSKRLVAVDPVEALLVQHGTDVLELALDRRTRAFGYQWLQLTDHVALHVRQAPQFAAQHLKVGSHGCLDLDAGPRSAAATGLCVHSAPYPTVVSRDPDPMGPVWGHR